MIRRALWGIAILFPLTAWGQLQLSVVRNGAPQPVGAALDFGSVPVGSSATLTLRAINTSDSTPVTIQSVAIAGTGFSLPGTYVFELPYVLTPGASWDFKLGFSPVSLGAAQGVLRVSPGIGVALTGAGTAALSVSNQGQALTPGANVSFGRVEMGGSALQTFSIENPNSTAIAVGTLQVSGPGFAQTAGPSAPFNVQAGASINLEVTFSPAAANAAQGALSVNQQTFILTGSGYAQPFPAVSIVFDQGSASSAQQRSLTITMASPATADASGNLELTFTPSSPDASDDSAIQFLSGNPRIAAVTIHKGDTLAHFGSSTQAAFQTGTTVGTVGFHLKLGNGTESKNTLSIAAETVRINSATAVAEPGQVILSLTGFDNTHAASQMEFTFYDSTGKAISPGAIQTDASQIFAKYFAGNPGGGAFALRAAFPVTGDPKQIAGARVEITNPAGSAQTPAISF